MPKPFIPKFPLLTSPFMIGSLALRSRMCSAPTGFPYITSDGCLTRDMTSFYELKAKGGAAVVTVSEAMTHKTGRSHSRVIDLTNPFVIQSLTDTARSIVRHGAVASIELNHSGSLSEFDVSADSRTEGKKPTINDMPLPLIEEIIESFGTGAALCKTAGFNMVMLHGGHGWLIEQFLSPAVNRRTDAYGGDLAGRARFALDVISAVRSHCGDAFPIEFRMSGTESLSGGYGIEGSVEFAKLIDGKVDLIHVSNGYGEEDFSLTHPPMFAPYGVNVHLAAAVKKNVGTPVATVGALGNPVLSEEIIRSGKADLIYMARALIADPFLPKKVEQNREAEITPCLRCFLCHAERMVTQTRICSVNPIIGREFEAKFEPRLPSVNRIVSNTGDPALDSSYSESIIATTLTSRSRRVLVVGGGPGGMTAALWAARRGHSVTLCEKDIRLGGKLNCEEGIPFKEASLRFRDTVEYKLRRLGIGIRLGVEVTPDLVFRMQPDALIIAVGAEPVLPDIPGITLGENVFFAEDMPKLGKNAGKSVAIIGGGLVGSETATHLLHTGRNVTIIEAAGELALGANPRHRPVLLDELAPATVYLNTKVQSASGGKLSLSNGKTVNADTVIISAGYRPLLETAKALRGIIPETAFVGDCQKPGRIRDAVFRGYHAAMDL
ncbi:MAG: FAD-dependent oxidoreductase [Oscillospiraceae bacterium]|jgi:2,4-dienoyl-CoA reductase-like NADH-dependent reductase (Old Yellow Enzyme family)/thioredoxin reductase|nr:FAD-dependent oxidoreductase [Oscillospiraceae bacterium]